MVRSNDIQVAKVLKRGIELYKSTFESVLKYSFIAVLVSSMLSVYMYFLEIVGGLSPLLYVIGLILLVILILPIIYYSVRVVATTVGKLKSVAFNEKYDFNEKYKLSKELFWRIVLVLFLKFILMTFFMLACFLLAIVISNIIYSGKILLFNMHPFMVSFSIVLSLMIAIVSLYILARLEFAVSIVYWGVETESSDVNQSFKMTKYHFLKKLSLIVIAHLPTMLLLAITIGTNIIFDGFIGNPALGLGNLVITIMLNTIIFTWVYSIYLALFEEMRAFAYCSSEKVDDCGREWLTY